MSAPDKSSLKLKGGTVGVDGDVISGPIAYIRVVSSTAQLSAVTAAKLDGAATKLINTNLTGLVEGPFESLTVKAASSSVIVAYTAL